MAKQNPIGKRLSLQFWLMVAAAFVLLIAAWTALISIAVKNRPEEVPLETEITRDGGPEKN